VERAPEADIATYLAPVIGISEDRLNVTKYRLFGQWSIYCRRQGNNLIINAVDLGIIRKRHAI
jgi:hypothetical protein